MKKREFMTFVLLMIALMPLISSLCIDSDKGKDFEVRGLVKYKDSVFETRLIKQDFCINENVLREYFCDDKIKFIEKFCEQGCFKGKCIQEKENLNFINFFSVKGLFDYDGYSENTCEDINCDDGNECTEDYCYHGDCINKLISRCSRECLSDIYCDDRNPCTDDFCVNGYCEYEIISDCGNCRYIDCDDGNECTEDYCYQSECFNDVIIGCRSITEKPKTTLKDSVLEFVNFFKF
ncbi:hypothetical protein GF386_03390 [Candidatus Pacearchaeota archaeon]|nr:hypothetical protein [Candidatus Pacearchaeota archaeon]MBD3283185.1 hypothetical protein [Candidatus Pacearchaeota archaeon]